MRWSGNVFLGDSLNNRVEEFDNGGTFLTTWGSSGTGDGQFVSSEGVAVDGNGNLFVSDENNSRVEKFTHAGTFQLAFGWGVTDGASAPEICMSMCQAGLASAGNGQFHIPLGVAADGSGNVFVADRENDRIEEFDGGGTFLLTWGSHGAANGQFNGATSVAVDGSGNVFVADDQNHRIQKFACPR